MADFYVYPGGDVVRDIVNRALQLYRPGGYPAGIQPNLPIVAPSSLPAASQVGGYPVRYQPNLPATVPPNAIPRTAPGASTGGMSLARRLISPWMLLPLGMELASDLAGKIAANAAPNSYDTGLPEADFWNLIQNRAPVASVAPPVVAASAPTQAAAPTATTPTGKATPIKKAFPPISQPSRLAPQPVQTSTANVPQVNWAYNPPSSAVIYGLPLPSRTDYDLIPVSEDVRALENYLSGYNPPRGK